MGFFINKFLYFTIQNAMYTSTKCNIIYCNDECKATMTYTVDSAIMHVFGF